MQHWNRFAGTATIALAFAIGGCGVAESIGSAIDETRQRLIDEAFGGVRDSAREAGGDAVQVTAEGGELAFEDPAHPLHRTRIRIPANALPADTNLAVLSAAPISGFTLPSGDWKSVGPAVEIALRSLPGLSAVTLLLDATVQLPVTATTAADPQLAHLPAATLEILEAATADNAAVAGLTRTFSPFVAVVEVDERAPLNRLEYAIAQTGTTVCQGAGPFDGSSGTHEAWLSLNADFETLDLQFVVNSGGIGEVGFYIFDFDLAMTPADLPVRFSLLDTANGTLGGDLWAYCGGGSTGGAFNWEGNGIARADFELLGFEVTGTTDASDCGDGSQSCTRNFGRIWYSIDLDFVDSNDDSWSATAKFDGLLPGARWETAP